MNPTESDISRSPSTGNRLGEVSTGTESSVPAIRKPPIGIFPVEPNARASDARNTPTPKAKPFLNSEEKRKWKILQTAAWLMGTSLVATLFFNPDLGISLFWNVLVPILPALVVFAPGVWRNVCPLANTALTLRKRNLSKAKPLSTQWRYRLNFLGVLFALSAIPMRHVFLDTNGIATGVVLVTVAILALALSFVFDWKSAWCAGMCPVHPIEKLYGQKPAVTPKNSNCGTCAKCSHICPDSAASLRLPPKNTPFSGRAAEILIVGGFAGFVWGWFQVPDYHRIENIGQIVNAYAYPFIGLAASALIYSILGRTLFKNDFKRLISLFACAAVSCYYWYRLPALFGFGPFPGDGMLFDLRDALPESIFVVSVRMAVISIFAYWFLIRKKNTGKWLIRPPLAKRRQGSKAKMGLIPTPAKPELN